MKPQSLLKGAIVKLVQLNGYPYRLVIMVAKKVWLKRKTVNGIDYIAILIHRLILANTQVLLRINPTRQSIGCSGSM